MNTYCRTALSVTYISGVIRRGLVALGRLCARLAIVMVDLCMLWIYTQPNRVQSDDGGNTSGNDDTVRLSSHEHITPLMQTWPNVLYYLPEIVRWLLRVNRPRAPNIKPVNSLVQVLFPQSELFLEPRPSVLLNPRMSFQSVGDILVGKWGSDGNDSRCACNIYVLMGLSSKSQLGFEQHLGLDSISIPFPPLAVQVFVANFPSLVFPCSSTCLHWWLKWLVWCIWKEEVWTLKQIKGSFHTILTLSVNSHFNWQF